MFLVIAKMGSAFTFQKELLIVLYVLLTFVTGSTNNTNEEPVKPECGELGDCPTTNSMNCHHICGCDRFAAFYYNETTGECLVSFKHLMVTVLRKYSSDVQRKNAYEHGMSQKIEMEAENIFNTLLISVMLIIICSIVCCISACLYCFRITYTDYRLKREIKDLTKKIDRKKSMKRPTKKPLPGPAAQSCNIFCEDAGVFVV